VKDPNAAQKRAANVKRQAAVKCCGTCAFAGWNLTPTGRIKRDESGRCFAPFTPPILPVCIPPPTYRRQGIGADDGKECPLYSPLQGERKTITQQYNEAKGTT